MNFLFSFFSAATIPREDSNGSIRSHETISDEGFDKILETAFHQTDDFQEINSIPREDSHRSIRSHETISDEGFDKILETASQPERAPQKKTLIPREDSNRSMCSKISLNAYKDGDRSEEVSRQGMSINNHKAEQCLQKEETPAPILEGCAKKIMSSLLDAQLNHSSLKNYTLLIAKIFEAAAILGGEYVVTSNSKAKQIEVKREKKVKDILRQYIYQSTKEIFEYRNNGDTILHEVVRYGDQGIEVTKLILNRLENNQVPCQTNLNSVEDFCNILNQEGKAPLHLAVTACAIKTIHLLKEKTTNLGIWHKFLKDRYRDKLSGEQLEKVKNFFNGELKHAFMVKTEYFWIFTSRKMNKKGIFNELKNNKLFITELLELPTGDLIDIVQKWSGLSDIQYQYLNEKTSFLETVKCDGATFNPQPITKKITLFFLECPQFIEKIAQHPDKYNYIKVMSQIYMEDNRRIQLETEIQEKIIQAVETEANIRQVLNDYFEEGRQLLICILRKSMLQPKRLAITSEVGFNPNSLRKPFRDKEGICKNYTYSYVNQKSSL